MGRPFVMEDSVAKMFLFGLPATCSRGFTFAGKKYDAGAVFPYEALGVIEHDVRGLWLADLVEFSPPRAQQHGKQQHAR